MRPLSQKFDELEDMLLHHRRTLAQNTGVPFLRLVYKPDEEIPCTRRRETLVRTLEKRQVTVEAVSCRGVIFAHYEERGRLEQLYKLEQTEPERLRDNIAKHARLRWLTRVDTVTAGRALMQEVIARLQAGTDTKPPAE